MYQDLRKARFHGFLKILHENDTSEQFLYAGHSIADKNLLPNMIFTAYLKYAGTIPLRFLTSALCTVNPDESNVF